MLKLFYVRADDEEGENYDCYTWSYSPQEAGQHCRAYWKVLSGYEPKVLWVDEMPTVPLLGAVPWETVKRTE